MSTRNKTEALARGIEAEIVYRQGGELNYAFAYGWTVSLASRLLALLTSPNKAERDLAKAEVRILAKLGGL